MTDEIKLDLSQYEMEDTAVLTVQNIKGDDDLLFDGKPVQIVMYGSGSKEGVKASHKTSYQTQLRSTAMFRGKLDKKIGESMDADEVDRLVGLTKEIINFPATAQQLYSNTKLIYITKQAQRFHAEDANFAKPSSVISPSTSASAPG